MSKEFPLSIQIGEVEREIKMRKSVYATRVAAGKMKQRDADLQINIMQEVLRTLTTIRERELGTSS